MKKMILIVSLVLLLGCVGLLLWAASAGPKTPTEVFELGLTYIRDGDYDRVWTLYTPRYQDVIRKSFDKQLASIRREIAANGPNLGVMAQFTKRQYGLSPAEVLRTPIHELHSRNLEWTREQRLRLAIVGEVRVEGDRATLYAREGDEGSPARFTFVKDEDGRWLIDDSTTGQPITPFGENHR